MIQFVVLKLVGPLIYHEQRTIVKQERNALFIAKAVWHESECHGPVSTDMVAIDKPNSEFFDLNICDEMSEDRVGATELYCG
jgi:hypothetical protein